MTIFYAVLVLKPPLGVWCAFAAYAHVVINPVLVGAALWADAHKNVPTITVDHSVVWGGLVCAMVLTSVGGVSSLHFCSKTMRDGGKTTDTFWKHETFRCYASAVFEVTSAVHPHLTTPPLQAPKQSTMGIKGSIHSWLGRQPRLFTCGVALSLCTPILGAGRREEMVAHELGHVGAIQPAVVH